MIIIVVAGDIIVGLFNAKKKDESLEDALAMKV